MSTERHDFLRFMSTLRRSMADDYSRIALRAKEDPGTAGDSAEENWAEFLRGWLPACYPVVTKGRLLGHDGSAGPQVDIIVLDPQITHAGSVMKSTTLLVVSWPRLRAS